MARRPDVVGAPATGGSIDPNLATEEAATT
jgi:hypothetical protein